MFHGKMKAVTFSYDDGVTQDIRLAELFHKYGLKATFNLNSSLLGQHASLIRDGVEIRHDKVSPADVRHIYDGHEIAAHTLTHPTLTHITDKEEWFHQTEDDRLRLSELAGYEVVGFAYPGGGINYNTEIAEFIRRNTGIRYCRTTVANHTFSLQDDLYEFQPTVYHHTEMDMMFALARKFLESTPTEPQIFYIWGHSYEFDIRNDWKRWEEFCRLISGRDDIFYGTNREVLLSSPSTNSI